MKKNFTFFWGKGSPFSNWSKTPFVFAGHEWNCSEQYMMFAKAWVFGDMEVCEKVLKTSDPREQKVLGRTVKNFDQKHWEKICVGLMVPALVAKFVQNEQCNFAMKLTIGTTLVEASPLDKVWGIGLAEDDPRAWDRSTWLGQNLLGICLMKARKEIFGE